jgi:ectoine hydroxylase-related dioxygenase (phytanoyl-CoA dioxygenase family)
MSTVDIPALPRSASPDQIYAVLKEHGAVRILNLVDEATMARIEAELLPAYESTSPSRPGEPNAEFQGLQTKRISGVIAKSRTAGELATHPLILQVLEKGLDGFQLHVSQAVCLLPGQPRQPLHRDDLVYPLVHPLEKEMVINVIWAVREFTEEMGGTRAIPGSHRWDESREPRDEETVATVMPRGSALVYFGSVWHGGGANQTTDQVRYMIAMAYSRNWLRQEENQFLVAPPHIAKDFPEALQRLIGYEARDPYLGWYDMKNPLELLKNGELG